MIADEDATTRNPDFVFDRRRIEGIFARVQAEHFRSEDERQSVVHCANNLDAIVTEILGIPQATAATTKLKTLLAQARSVKETLQYRSRSIIDASNSFSDLEAELLTALDPATKDDTRKTAESFTKQSTAPEPIPSAARSSNGGNPQHPQVTEYFELVSRSKMLTEDLQELEEECQAEVAGRQLLRDQRRTLPHDRSHKLRDLLQQKVHLKQELNTVIADASRQKSWCEAKGFDLVQARWQNADQEDLTFVRPDEEVDSPLHDWLDNVPGGKSRSEQGLLDMRESMPRHPGVKTDMKLYKNRKPEWYSKFRIFRSQWIEFEDDDDHLSAVTSLRSVDSVIGTMARIRTFIVVTEGKDSCTCLEVRTYGNLGVAKAGVLKDKHAVLYTQKVPEPRSEELPARGENGMRKEIRIKLDRPDDRLHEMSRVDYSRLFQVPQDVKTKALGFVHVKSRHIFEMDFKDALMPVLFGAGNRDAPIAGAMLPPKKVTARSRQKHRERPAQRQAMREVASVVVGLDI